MYDSSDPWWMAAIAGMVQLRPIENRAVREMTRATGIVHEVTA